MRCQANARLSPIGRRLLVDRIERDGWTVQEAAESAGISQRTARKWLARWRAEGEAGLLDRSSAPKVVANKTDPQTVAAICALRRLRFSGPELAELLGLPLSTVCAVLKRSGMGKLGRLGLEPARRDEHTKPGELIHIDVKKLGRIVGGAGKGITGGSSHYTGSFTDAAGRVRRKAGWGLRPRRDRRRHTPGLRRGPQQREGRHRRRVSAPRRGVLQAPRLRRHARADR